MVKKTIDVHSIAMELSKEMHEKFLSEAEKIREEVNAKENIGSNEVIAIFISELKEHCEIFAVRLVEKVVSEIELVDYDKIYKEVSQRMERDLKRLR